MKVTAREYQAYGDGKQKDTKAIQAAIDDCFQKGGGTVILENGTYISGTLYLKDRVTLRIEASARLLASPDIRDYGTDTHHNRYVNEKDMDRCFIYAQDAYEIGLEGDGEINGNPDAFPNPGTSDRPMMIRFLRCRRIHVSGLKLYDAAAWTTAFLDSSEIWIHGLDIKNQKHYNGDGLDFDGCRDVFVSGCRIDGTDDNLCLQAGNPAYPVQNIHIANCKFTSVCAGIRIGLKSIGTIRDVTVSNCTFHRIWREGIKLECSEGGRIENCLFQNLIMRDVRRPVYMILNNRFCPENGSSVELKEIPSIGEMAHIHFSNIQITDTEEMGKTHHRFRKSLMGEPRFNGIRIDANENHCIEDVSFSNVHYSGYGHVRQADIPESYPTVPDIKLDPSAMGRTWISENYYPDWSRTACMDIRNVMGLRLTDVVFELLHEDERPVYILEHCGTEKEDITIRKRV